MFAFVSACEENGLHSEAPLRVAYTFEVKPAIGRDRCGVLGGASWGAHRIGFSAGAELAALLSECDGVRRLGVVFPIVSGVRVVRCVVSRMNCAGLWLCLACWTLLDFVWRFGLTFSRNMHVVFFG